jgi:hypothetical protein
VHAARAAMLALFSNPLETQAMIYSTISFTVAPGKNFEANEYFHTVVRQVKKLTGSDVRILQQLAGPMGHYVLSSTFDSLAEWDQARAKIQNDTGFQKPVPSRRRSGRSRRKTCRRRAAVTAALRFVFSTAARKT